MWQNNLKVNDKLIVKIYNEFGIFLRDCKHSFHYPTYSLHKVVTIKDDEIITTEIGKLGYDIDENRIGLTYTFSKKNRKIKIKKFLYYGLGSYDSLTNSIRDAVILKYTSQNVEKFSIENKKYSLKRSSLGKLSLNNAEEIGKIIGHNLINYKEERQDMLLKLWHIDDIMKLKQITNLEE